MGSHSVNYPTKVNVPCLNFSQLAGTQFTYRRGMEGRADMSYLAMPATVRMQRH